MNFFKNKAKLLLHEISWQIRGVMLLILLGIGSTNASINVSKTIQSITYKSVAFSTREYNASYVVGDNYQRFRDKIILTHESGHQTYKHSPSYVSNNPHYV